MHNDSRHPRCRRQSAKGFTLVELLVVIGIIALLISILLPALSKARDAAAKAQCLSNQKQVVLAILMYAGDNQSILPGPVVPQALDPAITNYMPGDPVTLNAATGLPFSKIGVWYLGGNSFYEKREISNMAFIQKYLGGIQSRNVWFCPASSAVRDAYPISTSSFAGHQVGYAYRINSSNQKTGTWPDYLFGAYSSIGVGTPPVTEPDTEPKKLNSLYIVGNHTINDYDPAQTYSRDDTKVWLTSDIDAWNTNSTITGSFGLVSGGNTIANLSTQPYMPVHRINKSVPNGLGRNYGYLDGHVEFKVYGDWPDRLIN